MNKKRPGNSRAAALILLLPLAVMAQNPPARAPATPKASAPEDVTGYWVSLVTEDWRYRMLTPPKGDYMSVPLNAAGKTLADTWDPAKDEADHNECKAYGAPAIMRVPGRLHITWADDNTLRIETDAGAQVRTLHFGGASSKQAPDWQGYSAANWQIFAGRGGPTRGGYLKVVTTGMRPGYLRKNGVPYSSKAVLTEYYTRVKEPNNSDSYLIVTSVVDDPEYLTQPFVTSTNFKGLPDSSGWNPTPCSAK